MSHKNNYIGSYIVCKFTTEFVFYVIHRSHSIVFIKYKDYLGALCFIRKMFVTLSFEYIPALRSETITSSRPI